MFVGDPSHRFAHGILLVEKELRLTVWVDKRRRQGIDSKVVIDRDHNLREVNGTIYRMFAEPDRRSGLPAARFWFVCKEGDGQHNPSAAWDKFCSLKDLNL